MVKETPTLDMTVRDILARWPAAQAVLARRGLDLCCGGAHPLEMAARAHGFAPQDILDEVLHALKEKP